MDASNEPLGFCSLDTKIIQWDIPKDVICLLKLFKCISFGLTMVLKSSIQVCKYHYLERDPQAKQASMCHIMHDVVTTLSQLVANISFTRLPTFLTKHYFVGGIGFGQDWAY
jgi:hypothetical protein